MRISERASKGQGARIGMCNSAQSFHLSIRYSRQIRGLILLLIKKKSAFYQLKACASSQRGGLPSDCAYVYLPLTPGEARSGRLGKAAHRQGPLPGREQGHNSAACVDDLELNGRLGGGRKGPMSSGNTHVQTTRIKSPTRRLKAACDR